MDEIIQANQNSAKSNNIRLQFSAFRPKMSRVTFDYFFKSKNEQGIYARER